MEVERSREASADHMDEEEWTRPILSSTPKQNTQQDSDTDDDLDASDEFVSKLYDVVICGSSITKPGVCKNTSEVGTIEKLRDTLVAAETDTTCGPQYDVRLWQSFLKEKQVPQRLMVLCVNANEVQLQSYTHLAPACVIRYRLTDGAVQLIRNITMSDTCVNTLNKCHIYVARVGSRFDDELCGNKKGKTKMEHIELRVLQPTMSPSKMVVGDVLTGREINFERIQRAVDDALDAVWALRTQRNLLNQARTVQQQGQGPPSTSDDGALDTTVVDSALVRKRRQEAFDPDARTEKRVCAEEMIGDSEGEEDSGTVILKSL